jgi:formiminotetrahydrofolate cyclodeaminase
VAAAAARAAARGAYWNVLINLKSLAEPDSDWAQSAAATAARTLAAIEREAAAVDAFLERELARPAPAIQRS